jgi:uncharacterized protein (TIGR02598 family)
VFTLFKNIGRNSSAFSLVEVVLALGVTSFVLMALLGTLPAGVKSIKDSMNESARANIMQEIRAELEEVSFGSSATATNNIVTTLSQQTNYYTPEGLPLTNTGASIPPGAYYEAVFAAANAPIPSTSASPAYFQYESAQTVQVTLIYPLNASVAGQTQTTNYLLTAKQKSY